MIFNPKNLTLAGGEYLFNGKIVARCHHSLANDSIKLFWHNFSFGFSDLETVACDEYVFTIGDAQPVQTNGCAYSINVQPNGICLSAKNEHDLKYAFMTLLDMFTCCHTDNGEIIKIACCSLSESPVIENRIVHFCVFPETELWVLQRFVRFAAALKYTHIIIEFWGTLHLDSMKELAWKNSYTKEQIAPIVQEAHELGLKIIPFFAHWGHATMSRVLNGKHVVLDQNPSLQSYFNEDGWCWNIADSRVRKLLKSVRGELMELFGDCEYFHIGCDEAFSFKFTKENMDMVCDYLNEVAADLLACGRKPVMWGDMLIHPRPYFNKENNYTCLAPSLEIEKYLTSRLDKNIIIADWQYSSPVYPVETAKVFVENGFQVMLSSYDSTKIELDAVQKTVIEQKLKGHLHTTWCTLTRGMPMILMAAVGSFEQDESCVRVTQVNTIYRTQTAALLRKVMPVNGDYEKSGWSKVQIETTL